MWLPAVAQALAACGSYAVKKTAGRKGPRYKIWLAICAPVDPRTISLVMKSFKASSTDLINRQRGEPGELWHARFFDRALRTMKESNEKVEYIHLNPVKLVATVNRVLD